MRALLDIVLALAFGATFGQMAFLAVGWRQRVVKMQDWLLVVLLAYLFLMELVFGLLIVALLNRALVAR